jgi:hypothetical protein
MRVFLDITVSRHGDEWIAISREPGIAGETLMLDVVAGENGDVSGCFPVCVIESRPVIVEGDLRHRIRLHPGLAPVLFEQQIRR